jgi:hypothetical protein
MLVGRSRGKRVRRPGQPGRCGVVWCRAAVPVRRSAVTWTRTAGAPLPSSRVESVVAPWRGSSVKVSEASCSVLRLSEARRSARVASLPPTNRAPPRFGEVARSHRSVMVAADSGSITPTRRVIPSACRTHRRLRAVWRACSRTAMPASSISCRSCRARMVSRSASRVVASTQRCSAAVANMADDGTESEGVPSPLWMASAVELDSVPAETVRPTERNDGWARLGTVLGQSGGRAARQRPRRPHLPAGALQPRTG